MKTFSVKCPNCGASLEFEEGRTKAFCSYCGTQIVLNNENEHIFRHIDEADIIHAETEKAVRLKELELEELRNKQFLVEEKQHRLIRKLIIIGAIIVILAVFVYSFISKNEKAGALGGLLCMGLFSYVTLSKASQEQERKEHAGFISVLELGEYKKKHYSIVENTFRSLGFSLVRCSNLHDLPPDYKKTRGLVASIMIDGKDISTTDGWLNPKSSVLIYYHDI